MCARDGERERGRETPREKERERAVGNEAGKHALVSLLALPLRDGDARAKTNTTKGAFLNRVVAGNPGRFVTKRHFHKSKFIPRSDMLV